LSLIAAIKAEELRIGKSFGYNIGGNNMHKPRETKFKKDLYSSNGIYSNKNL
jgi:hypothetical protein